MATHSSILAWKIPWTEKPGRLQSMGSQRVTKMIQYMQGRLEGCTTNDLAAASRAESESVSHSAMSSSMPMTL